MKRLLLALSCLALTTHAHAARFDANRGYPKFQIGVTGITATFEKGLVLTVQEVLPGSPAAGALEKGDIILAAGGKTIEGADPRVPLGEAVGAAEAKKGRLTFKITRNGAEKTVTITLPVLGPYSRTWPLDCRKSKTIIRQTAEFLVKAQQPDGSYTIDKRSDRDGLSACLMGLFLLSTGEAKYLPNVRLQARALSAKAAEHPTGSTWHLGYQGILLGEYYLKTGDSSVLAGLKSLCDQAARTQAAGSWGHGGVPNPGYVQSGLMNSAATPVLTVLTLARECGITSSEDAFERALKFFYRMAGHGAVCYGDHRAELFPNTNGRNGKLACALILLDEPRFQRAAEHLALVVSDSYYAPEFGHTGGGFNVMWRGIATSLIAKNRQSHYRRQMDKLAWYYDLARLPGGGFSMLPSPPNTTRYCGAMWGSGAVGLTYTAPLETLRITGAPRTKYSVKTKSPAMTWGAEADLAFLSSDPADGYGGEVAQPHETYEILRGKDKAKAPVDFCVHMMRHANPMFRTWAARRLGDRAEPADVDALAKALAHPDPRVRRAAFDGFNGYDNWGRPTHPSRVRGKVPPAVVSERFLPAIEKTLNDPKSAWWEIDGALFALGRALPADIRKNMPAIRTFAKHEEWYLR
ncbi:PDZ domain-containing protein, partial [bacterium]|nr:PDZ domain-containing protein [bacterium]